MKITILPTLNLKLETETDDERETVQRAVSGDLNRWSAWAELLEPFSTNGSYQAFDASDANPFVGLTGAPCIAECIDIDDDGRQHIDGRFWYFARYMLADELEELLYHGHVIFEFSGVVARPAETTTQEESN